MIRSACLPSSSEPILSARSMAAAALIVAAAIAALPGTAGAETEWAPLAAGLESTLLVQSILWLAGTLLGSWLVVRVTLMFSGFER